MDSGEEPPEIKFQEEIAEFNRMVPKAALIHAATWCVKRQCVIPTIYLTGQMCVPCEEFVLRGGVCDPL